MTRWRRWHIYLPGDALGIELIADEARIIGREAERALKTAKIEADKLRSRSSAKRSKATKAAEASEEKAKALPKRLADLDAELEAARVAFWAVEVQLPWPSQHSRVEIKPEVKPKVATARQLAALQKKYQAAEEAAAVAESEAEREEKRAHRLNRTDLEWMRYLSGIGEGWTDDLLPDDISAARQAELEAWAAASKRAREKRAAATKMRVAAEEARDAAEEEVASCEFNSAPPVVKSEREASLEAEVAMLQIELDELRMWKAEREALDAELLKHQQEPRCAEVESEIEDFLKSFERRETRLRLEAGARAVWASESGTEKSSSPKVFSLVGKSAEEVKTVASKVSQDKTPTEERLRLKKIEDAAMR